MFAALLGLVRCNPEAVATCSQALADIVSRYDLAAWWAGWVTFLQGWAMWSDGAGESRLAEMRRGLAMVREQGNVWFLPSLEAALAEAEARAGETDAGLRRLDDALADAERTEQRWYEAELYRIRGEILLKCDPANTAAAEQSLQAAITIAQSQKARSFELRAALSLAKLYRAANRDADAHAVLAPAVEGFPPTQQFPEYTEAQALFSALSESDAVKSDAALRQRRLHLQISLGNALICTKGYRAPETRAAFLRARALASRVEDASERFSAYYGPWAGHASRGEPAAMRDMVELFLREAAARPDCPEAAIAHRISGQTCWYFGDFAGAHDHFRKTVALYDPARHGDFANRFGQDPRAATEIWDAFALWVLGRVDEALPLAERSLADAESSGHAPTMGYALNWAARLGLFRRNSEAVATYSQAWPISSLDTISQPFGSETQYFFRAGQSHPMAPKSRDSPTCDAASPSVGSKAGIGSCPVSKRPWPKLKRVPVRPMPGSGAWTMRSPSWSTPSNTGTKRKSTASGARSCSSATRLISRRPSSLCRPRSR
jgi:predicted ATPase